jgi:hypothetical protein
MAVRLSALRAGRPLPPGRCLVLISVRDRVDHRAIVRLEGLDQLQNRQLQVSKTGDVVTGWMIRVQFSGGAFPLPRSHSCVDVRSELQGLKAEGICEAENWSPLRAQMYRGLPLRNYVTREFTSYSMGGASKRTGFMPTIRLEQNNKPRS